MLTVIGSLVATQLALALLLFGTIALEPRTQTGTGDVSHPLLRFFRRRVT